MALNYYTATPQEVYKDKAKWSAVKKFLQVILSGESKTYYDYNGTVSNTGLSYAVYWDEKNNRYYSSNSGAFILRQRLDKYTLDQLVNGDGKTLNKGDLYATGKAQLITPYLLGVAKNAGVSINDFYTEDNQNLICLQLLFDAGKNLNKKNTDSKGNTLDTDYGKKFLFGGVPFTEEYVDHLQLACSSVWSSIGVPYDTTNYGKPKNPKRIKGQCWSSPKDKVSVFREAFFAAAVTLREEFNGDKLATNSSDSNNSSSTSDTPTSTLNGTILDSSGQPIPDAQVTATITKYPDTPFKGDTTQSDAFRVWLLNKYPDYNDKRKQPGYPPSVLYRVDVPPQPYTNSEALKKAYYEKGREYEEENGLPLSEFDELVTDQTIVKTDANGNWIITSDTDVASSSVNISIFTDNYGLTTINSVLPSNTDPNVYNVPRLTLTPAPDPIKTATDQALSIINESEYQQAADAYKSRANKLIQIVSNLNIKKEDLKRLLTPFVIKLLAAFGPTLVQAIIKNLPLDQIKNLINCPPSATIIELINKRNKLAKQINNVYNQIKTLNTVLDTSNKIITALKIGIQIIETIPYPATGVPPLGLPPLTSGAIEKLGSAKDKIIKTLEVSQSVIDIATIASASLGVVLGIILRLLNSLDVVIQYCSKEQNVSFELINNELNSFVNTSTGESNSQVISNTQNDRNNYKGFKLELKLDETNKTQYPRRYAQALTKQGTPVLKTESSFASDPQVLLDQLKFIIDSSPNITAE